MKLHELTEMRMFRNNDEYSRYLETQGYNVPKIRNKKGFILVVYAPDKSKETFKTLGDAENAAPTRRGIHWQVFDGKTGAIALEPQWVFTDNLVSQINHSNY